MSTPEAWSLSCIRHTSGCPLQPETSLQWGNELLIIYLYIFWIILALNIILLTFINFVDNYLLYIIIPVHHQEHEWELRSRCVIFSISKFCKYFSANVRYKMQEVVRRCQEAARSRVLSPISRHKNIILEPDSAAGHILVIGAAAARHRSASRI